MGNIHTDNKHSFSVFDASAGSGKTYTLVKEYLKIVLTSKKNDAYRNILAITFTNKAVHEMKSRIVQNLYEFSKENTADKPLRLLDEIAMETQVSVPNLKWKAKQTIKHLVHNYATFDILTIDKFTHKVIRAFAHDLNLPITFEVTLDTDSLLSEAVDAIISQAGENKTITNLLIDFTIEKIDDDKSWDITREIFEISKLVYNENNKEQINELKDKTIQDFVAVRQKIRALKETLESQNKVYGACSIKLMSSSNINPKSFSREVFPNHLISISEGKYRIGNKKFYESDHIQINKSATDRAAIEAVIPELLAILEKVYSNFEKIQFYEAFLKNITPLSLLNTISLELARIQKEQNILSIAEFNSLIYNEIQNQPAPFIYEKLGEKYHHFFIDEFQDTSEMQWKNLIPLIDNALSSEFSTGEKGTLLIVGDPKQSIYRWRGGKAEQFIALCKNENPFHNPDKAIFHLDTNFRSYSQVVEFNNDFFRFLSSEFTDADYMDLYENHSHQNINSKKGGFVDLTFLNTKAEEELSAVDGEEIDRSELFCMITFNKIEEIISRGFDYKDIAILTRKKTQGVWIANYLATQKVPIISSETLLVSNSEDVQFIISVLGYLNNQDNLEAKADFLYYLASKNQETHLIHDFISAGMKHKTEGDFEAWLFKFDISIIFKGLRTKSLYEVVELLIASLVKDNYCNVYIQCFLDIVLERDYHKQAGISDFLVFWEKNLNKFSIPSPEGDNAVRILTIHKSKGLEFPVVIIPFADEDYERKPKDKIWIEDSENDFDMPKALVDNTKSIENFGKEAVNIYKKQKEEELLDNINILYVALTRAEEQLFVISTLVKPKKDGEYPYNMASFFVKYLKNCNIFEDQKLQYNFGQSEKLSKKILPSRDTNVIASVSSKFDPKKIRIAQKESLMWGTSQQSSIEYGNVIHEILAKIINKNDVDDAISNALETGLIPLNQKQLVYKTISEIVNHDDLRVYYSPENNVYNEQAIIQNKEKTVIPDRIVITSDNEVFLLDYKTGIHQNKHKVQLDNYHHVLEKMNFKVKAKTLIYIGDNIELVQF
ncbi:MAG: UvrD-helicase domain-containing protein [Flavobacterium sp.]|nr:UvrD-helicase domain-containing protein [Flavobacterium sp.]